MHIRDIFASNLRRLTEARGSINYVCRQLGMHRNQFAIYLRGERLPNKKTMERFSSYFRVPEDSFFVGARDDLPDTHVDTICSQVVARAKASPPTLPHGRYQTYFWAPALEDNVVTALTVIKEKEGFLTFRRLTASGERKDPTWSYVKGDHQGIVSERMGWMYFQGSNRIEPQEPTLLALKWAALSEPLLVGHGMVTSHLGPMIVHVVMTPHSPSVTLLAAIRRARVHNLEDPKLALISRFLKRSIIYDLG